MKGIDYAWHDAIDWACLEAQGVRFICRYFSWDASKDLTVSELHAANQSGIAVVVVWETTANRMLSGYAGGVEDATETNTRLTAYGMNDCPAYFACDWDASESEQTVINAYLDGAASIMGRNRVGMYGGYWPVNRAFNAGKIVYGWQTYAWSGGNWDARAQLRQTQNGVTVCGISADWDESRQDDFAQWPRPGSSGTPPETERPPTSTAPHFPYASDHYLGLPSPDPHCHSGHYGGIDSTNVGIWQGQMAHRGWHITVDGDYGTQSRSVCVQFQTEKGLAVDGFVGPNTWNKAWTAPIT